MNKGRVHHAIGCRSSTSQTLEILQIAAMRRGAGGYEGLGARLRAGKTQDLMARAEQLLNRRRTDKPRRTGDEHTHEKRSTAWSGPQPAVPWSAR